MPINLIMENEQKGFLSKIQKQIVAKLSAAQEYKKQLLEQKAKLKELFDSALHRSMNSRQLNQQLNAKNCVIL